MGVDYGLCCPARSDGQNKGIVGTLLYMAPEVFSGIYSTPVDLWSTGVLLYIILTGRTPWVQDPERGLQMRKEVLNGAALEEAFAAPEISVSPPGAVELLKGLLLHSSEQRLTASKALQQKWFTQRTTERNLGVGKKGFTIDVNAATYNSVRQHTLATPVARLGLLVSLEDENETHDGRSNTNDSGTVVHGPSGRRARKNAGYSMCCSIS